MDHSFLAYILVGLVLFFAHVVSGVTGFGTNIVALPLLTLLVGLAPGRVSIVLLSTFMYAVLAIQWRRRVAWKELFAILIVAGAGLLAGVYFLTLIPARVSIITLGIFVAIVGLQGLFYPKLLAHVPMIIARVFLFLGGAVHGAFTVGGPLVVIYGRRVIHDKTTFRATLCVMWVALNAFLIAGWTYANHWPEKSFTIFFIGLPFAIAGMVAGEWIHHRVDAKQFQMWVNALLIVTGAILALTAK